MARLREAEGDLDAALELLDEADRVYDGDYSPNVRPVPAVRARLRLRRGELDQAEAWARERQLVRRRRAVLPARVRARHPGAAPARPHASGRTSTRPSACSSGCSAAAEEGGRGGSVIEVLVLLALAHQAGATCRPRSEALRRAVTLAQPEGYVRLFADEGPPMAALLRRWPGDRRTRYVRRLLAPPRPGAARVRRRAASSSR